MQSAIDLEKAEPRISDAGLKASYVGSFEFKDSCARLRYDEREMSTAIVSVYTDEGFVIGADGRRVDAVTKTIQTDTARKIFTFKSGEVALAFAWCGTTIFIKNDGQCVELSAITNMILDCLDASAVSDFAMFIEQFRKALYGMIGVTLGNQWKSAPVFSGEVARILFVGYFRDQPYRASISIRLENRVILPPVIDEITWEPGDFLVFSGSETYRERFQSKIAQMGPPSKNEAIALVRDYIQSCVNDPECKDIGGHIHIGVVTPQRLNWVDGPLEA